MMSFAQVRDVCLELGFREVQAAGSFRWYEYPFSDEPYKHRMATYVRVQFYGPASDLQVWIVHSDIRSSAGGPSDEIFNDEAIDEEQLVAVLQQAVRVRMMVAIEDLVRWDAVELEGVPRGLIEAARSPRRDERLSAQAVIADWLLERGIEF